MSPDDALRLADHLAGLFPDMTPAQVDFCSEQFKPFDPALVQHEITRYRRHFDVLNLANLLRRITDESQKRTPRPTNGDRRAVEQQWKENDAAIAKMTDAELSAQKQSILDAHPDLRPFLADKSPRDSVMLRSLILQRRTNPSPSRR